MVITPVIAAGRGMRAFIGAAVVETAVVLLIWILNLSALTDAAINWRTDGLTLIPFVVLWLFPITLGGIVLYVKNTEDKPRKNVCRSCGYDLRESPVRCPECGRAVRDNPDRF